MSEACQYIINNLRFNSEKISKLQSIFETNATQLENVLQTQTLTAHDDKKACQALISYYKGCGAHLQQIILEYGNMNQGLMTASTKSELLKVIENSLNKLQIDLNSIQDDDDWTGIETYRERAEDAIYRNAQQKSLTILRQWHLINNIYKVGHESLSKLADRIGHMLSKIAAYIVSDIRTLRMLKVCIANNTEDSDEKVVYNLRRALDNMANLAPINVKTMAKKFEETNANLPGSGIGKGRVDDGTAGNEGSYTPPRPPPRPPVSSSMRAEQQLLKLLKV